LTSAQCGESLFFGRSYAKLPAYFSDQAGSDFVVSRHEALVSGLEVLHPGVTFPFLHHGTSMIPEIAKKFLTLHPAIPDCTRMTRRIGSWTRAFLSVALGRGAGKGSPSCKTHSAISCNASRNMRLACPKDLPCVTTPGKSKTFAVYQPPSLG